jgi:hypothetical protein
MKKMLDLFSGLGGASQAFVESDAWEVIRFDNNPAFYHLQDTWMVDILDLADKVASGEYEMENFDLVWASPPCLEFSMAYSAPRSKALREGEEYNPNMDLVKATKAIIETGLEQNPQMVWVVENVAGASKYFEPIFGQPRQIVGAFYLWGNFPYLSIPRSFKHYKDDNDPGPRNPLRSNYRAKIPWTISEALRLGFTRQTRLKLE